MVLDALADEECSAGDPSPEPPRWWARPWSSSTDTTGARTVATTGATGATTGATDGSDEAEGPGSVTGALDQLLESRAGALMTTAPASPAPPASGPDGRRLETPRAAGVAGLAFAALFVASILLLRSQPSGGSTAAEIRDFYLREHAGRVALVGVYLAPFSGIAFLWFIAVVRNLIGDREDRFFATVFLGSGLLFVAMLFIAAGVGGALLAAVKFQHEPVPSAETRGDGPLARVRVPLHLRDADGRRVHDRRLDDRDAPRRASRAGSSWPATSRRWC